jgi:hypothetical protein
MYEETKIAVFTKPPFNQLYFEAVNLTCVVEVTNSTLGKETTSLRLLVILLSYCR